MFYLEATPPEAVTGDDMGLLKVGEEPEWLLPLSDEPCGSSRLRLRPLLCVLIHCQGIDLLRNEGSEAVDAPPPGL